MRVLFLVPYPEEGASNRFRVNQYLPALAQNGIDYSVRSFWSSAAFRVLYTRGNNIRKTFFFILGSLVRLIDLCSVYRYDLVFVHREAYPIGPAFIEGFLHLIRKPMIYDFDDAIFLPASSRQNLFIGRFKNHDKVRDIIKMSGHVIAGNNYLASFARAYNTRVSVIPTVIDTAKVAGAGGRDEKYVVIGWIGSATTSDFLKPMEGVFKTLLAKFSNLRILIIGGMSPVGGDDRVLARPWSLSTEAQELSRFDIGIMPMPDDPWTKGKCGFKAIMYMGMSIPCVCSAVGTNNEIITDGVNGYLAQTDEEWVRKLSLLIADRPLRARIGAAARKTVEERYSLKAYSGRFVGILTENR
jgi:glycosyltransferase involved in cell wall biosynthesis